MPHRFIVNGGPVLAPRDAAATLRREHGTASRGLAPARDRTTAAILRAAIAARPHAIDAPFFGVRVRAID